MGEKRKARMFLSETNSPAFPRRKSLLILISHIRFIASISGMSGSTTTAGDATSFTPSSHLSFRSR